MKLDVSKLTAKLDAIPKRTEAEVKDSLRESGKDLKARSRSVAPYRPGDSEHLRDKAYSKVTRGDYGPELEVGYEGPAKYLFVQHEGGWENFMGKKGLAKEIRNYTTLGTGKKFLEGPWVERKEQYVRDLRDDAKRGLRG